MSIIWSFIKNPLRTGAIVPSSKKLASLIANSAKIKNAKLIVELGSGSGIFTGEILKHKHDKTKFFSLEINKDLANKVQKKYPKSRIYADSIENIKKYLGKQGLPKKIDYIVSGLPWASFDTKMQDKFLKEIYNNLSSDGEFRTYAYVHASCFPNAISFKRKLEKKFSKVAKSRIVWNNIPPAFIYICKK
jgi:phospholipid N-methyltransferase